MFSWLTPPRRKAIYALAIAVGAVLVAFGLLSADKADAIPGVVLALTNLLAVVNVK